MERLIMCNEFIYKVLTMEGRIQTETQIVLHHALFILPIAPSYGATFPINNSIITLTVDSLIG